MALLKNAPSGKITNANIVGNVQIGGETMIENQGEIEHSNIKSNIQIESPPTKPKRWWLHLAESIVVSVIAGLILLAITIYLGLR
ncbi:MAG TPA: hypothetical protein VFW59_09225 [Gallionella sp.]|nr:hypothetical protein [Gallionella sp.]